MTSDPTKLMAIQTEPPALGAEAPVILVGNPNVGKSALFGALTGRYVQVSNFPGTTIEICSGRIDDKPLIDTPGVQSLTTHSEEEQVALDILLAHDDCIVVQVADARNLRRTLLLTVQLAELGRRFVLNLNMIDEAQERGLTIDAAHLARILRSEVVETVAIRSQGITALRKSIRRSRPAGVRVDYDAPIERAIERIAELLPADLPGARGVALLILTRNDTVSEQYTSGNEPSVLAIVEEAARHYDKPLSFVIAQQRLAFADRLVDRVVRRADAKPPGWREAFGRLAIHPLWGWAVLTAALTAMYLLVGGLGAGVLVDWMESVVFGQWINPVAIRLAELIPARIVVDLLVGEYGLITMGMSYAIAIVLPIVFTFFLAFGVIEDSGYLPRLAVMLNRPFKAMGLNGKAVLPMVLGLGCDTMATLTTRILDTRKDRVLVTLLLALGVPCSAQLGVIMGMTGQMPPVAVGIWAAVVVGVLFVVGWVAGRLIPGERSDFILELPPIRRPQLSNILIKTVARMEWYLKEVLPLFLIATLILFVLDRTGTLAALERWASPFVQGMLGLPAATTGVFIVGFLRRDYGAAGLFSMTLAGALTTSQLLVSLVVITLFVPCIANVIVIIRERGWKTGLAVVLFVLPFAFAVGAALNIALRTLGVSFG